MEIKKSKKADIEKHKTMFFKIGIIVSLSFLLLAFEYKSENFNDYSFGEICFTPEPEIDVVIYRQQKPEPPKPKLATVITPKPDDEVIEEDEIKIPETEDGDIIDTYTEDPEEEELETIPYYPYQIEKSAIFPGGEKALMKFIIDNTIYPQICKENGITGQVIIRFVVSNTGEVIDAEIAKHADRALEKEALRVVGKMPKWKPGLQNTKPVSMYFHLPINFDLN